MTPREMSHARTTAMVASTILGGALVPVEAVARLVCEISETIAALHGAAVERPQAAAEPHPAAVVASDWLECRACGKRLRSLTLHLNEVHRMTPERYRELCGLEADAPMVATATSARMSARAKQPRAKWGSKTRHGHRVVFVPRNPYTGLL
jgi:predicted transcriptional regulator